MAALPLYILSSDTEHLLTVVKAQTGLTPCINPLTFANIAV